ncbi:flagellar basal body FlaE domain-containing protein [Ectothiorhodospira sp. PHS-1]|uniref:flagellar hook protein FlgE n=1 Tax=Ectothiorhodospira sp. PHS-1 TaxID=519989 RepID=UPI00024A82FD|nr:flagellar hook protein FlgE [Ectothiorhodospira sp. PHS-1]EHQ52152.1 flagellar basal body FlaE domain-containing protein [Ectothiorhodospira sp. PHS-1]
MPSFNIGLTGLNAASSDLQVTGHNIANSSTAGFKRSRAEFADVFALSYTGVSKTATGSGVNLASVTQQFTQGDLNFSDNNLDLAINGQGFFILDRDGITEYTRAGQFQVDKDGFIVNSAGQRLQGYPPEGGNLLQSMQLTIGDSEPQPTTAINALMNLSSDAEPVDGPIDPEDPETYNYSTSLTIYDSLGSARAVTLFFRREDPPENKTWEVVAAIREPDGTLAIVGNDTLVFNNDGTLASGELEINYADPPNGADDLEITVDFGDTTQYGSRFSVAALRQDGYTAGQLVSVDVDSDGTIFARYSNGANRSLGQVALANFDNPQGLQPVGGTNWVVTAASGEPLLGRGGESNFGLVQGGAYEAANVNIADQLVKLITAQRNFQANAQVISTADTLTQTIINIR